MKKIKHIIWDWNGTLLNDCWLCVKAINKALAKRNLDLITEEKYKDIFCFPVSEYYKRLGFDFSKEPFKKAGDEFVLYYGANFEKVKLHSDSLIVLDAIKSSGRTQSILSAGKQEFLTNWVEYHNLSKYFINVLGIDNHYAAGKKSLGVNWIQQLEYNNDEVLMIGDTIHDSEVAEAMGIECILVGNGHVSDTRLKKTGRRVILDLSELLVFI